LNFRRRRPLTWAQPFNHTARPTPAFALTQAGLTIAALFWLRQDRLRKNLLPFLMTATEKISDLARSNLIGATVVHIPLLLDKDDGRNWWCRLRV
jgi:hypothetical protein